MANWKADCDHWTGSRYCGADAPLLDEVTDEFFCLEHAGPLGWPARDVNLYSLALKAAGRVDRPIPVPQLERAA